MQERISRHSEAHCTVLRNSLQKFRYSLNLLFKLQLSDRTEVQS